MEEGQLGGVQRQDSKGDVLVIRYEGPRVVWDAEMHDMLPLSVGRGWTRTVPWSPTGPSPAPPGGPVSATCPREAAAGGPSPQWKGDRIIIDIPQPHPDPL